ncbi:MAG TPA: hypothetical protein VGH92_10980, partial [Gaiellaceae bacterium]
STIPLAAAFDSVYDTGTYQNFPTVGNHFFFGTRGEYLFNLTASALDTRALAPGAYTLTVSAVDTCGNRGTLTEKLDVARQQRLPSIHASLTALTPSRPWPRRFWTVVLVQPGTQERARDVVLARALAARATSPALLTERNGPIFGIEGAFSSWGAAYTEAQRVARSVPGAYVRQVLLAAPPLPLLIPEPGKPSSL